MKHLLPGFALLISSLFAPVAVSAAPLVCSGNTGLVYVLAASCAAANEGVMSGFTVGNCLVVQADFSLGGGACGGSGPTLPLVIAQGGTGQITAAAGLAALGGGSLAGNNTWTGQNTYGTPGVDGQLNMQIAQSSAGDGTFNVIGPTVGTALQCGNINGDTTVYELGGSPAMAITTGGQIVAVCNRIIIGDTAHSDFGRLQFGDQSGPSMVLGRVGAPAGACVSGSLYTRSDGAVGSTLYACEASAWVAAGTP